MIVIKAMLETSEINEIRRVPMSRLPGELNFDEVFGPSYGAAVYHVVSFVQKEFVIG